MKSMVESLAKLWEAIKAACAALVDHDYVREKLEEARRKEEKEQVERQIDYSQ